MCTYCGSGFILLICVQLYKQNRYRYTEIKGYLKGVESSSIYPIRAVMLCVTAVGCGPVIPISTFVQAGVGIRPVYVSGHYGDSVQDGGEYYFYFWVGTH